jgi:hypothetical protein
MTTFDRQLNAARDAHLRYVRAQERRSARVILLLFVMLAVFALVLLGAGHAQASWRGG